LPGALSVGRRELREMPTEFLLKAFVTLFVIVDPLALAPVFLALTSKCVIHAALAANRIRSRRATGRRTP
jgi:small neutral amino acid transporter SnatA (MarC family)